jgi:hypothetical protein
MMNKLSKKEASQLITYLLALIPENIMDCITETMQCDELSSVYCSNCGAELEVCCCEEDTVDLDFHAADEEEALEL